MTWRYRGGAGDGRARRSSEATSSTSLNSSRPDQGVRGAVMKTFITERPVATSVVRWTRGRAVGSETEPVENEDVVSLHRLVRERCRPACSRSPASPSDSPTRLGFSVFAGTPPLPVSTRRRRRSSSSSMRRAGADRRLPARACGARPSVPGARPADDALRCRLRLRRAVRVPGPGIPRPGGRRRGASALPVVRDGLHSCWSWMRWCVPPGTAERPRWSAAPGMRSRRRRC